MTIPLLIPPFLRRVIPRVVPQKLAQVAALLIEPDEPPAEEQGEPEADAA